MEETNAMSQQIATEEAHASDSAFLLSRFIEQNAASLMTILRGYVRKADIVPANEEAVQEAALELLNEVYLEAVKIRSNFDPSRPPKAWLLGIASNLILRKKSSKYKNDQREIALSDLRKENQAELSDEDVLEHLTLLAQDGPEQQIVATEQFEYLLSLVSESDQQILRLVIELDLDGKLLAQELGCSYNAAMVRLYRARQRLRTVLERQKGESNG
jgi:RNA polymerase sigma factor (sigma-70 family)